MEISMMSLPKTLLVWGPYAPTYPKVLRSLCQWTERQPSGILDDFLRKAGKCIEVEVDAYLRASSKKSSYWTKTLMPPSVQQRKATLSALIGLTFDDNTTSPDDEGYVVCASLAHAVAQIATYIWWLETDTSSSHTQILHREGIDFTGFCAGYFPAYVLGCSRDKNQSIKNALQLVRFAFWVGIVGEKVRRQSYEWRLLALDGEEKEQAKRLGFSASWGFAIHGWSVDEVSSELEKFNRTHATNQPTWLHSLYIANTSSPTLVTVSGPPDLVQKFLRTASPSLKNDDSVAILPLPMLGPFHSSSHHSQAFGHVMRTLKEREITLPDVNSLQGLLFSTVNGGYLHPGSSTHTPVVNSDGSDDGASSSGKVEGVKLSFNPLEHLLNVGSKEVCRWEKTAETLADLFLQHGGRQGSKEELKIVSFGPDASLARQLRDQIEELTKSRVEIEITIENVHTKLSAATRALRGPVPKQAADEKVVPHALAPSSAEPAIHGQPKAAKEHVAIVGIGCKFPGGVESPDDLWDLLKAGKCTMEEIPASRFNIEDYYGEGRNKMLTRHGHFIHDAGYFDAEFFHMSPREALNTDPQQRLLLEVVVNALDDAGYKPADQGGHASWNREKMGVFVGCSDVSYQNNLWHDTDPFFCPGTIRGFLAGRLSYHFGFKGPSMVIDSACASSFSALHSACQSLLTRECDAAVVAGANLLTSPEAFISLAKGFFISHTGGCRTFDATADGYCRADGIAAIVLKRESNALAENDNVHGTILASGVNQSSQAASLTTPHPETLHSLFTENCRRAGVSPSSIIAVESHGTGTKAGDPAEVDAIKSAFCIDRDPINNPLFLASIKPNIGHSEATSGLASLIKALLMMRHKEAPPHIGVTTELNPLLGDLEAASIKVPRNATTLKAAPGEQHFIMSVNNFGAPGTNANVIIAGPRKTAKKSTGRKHHLVTLSAHTKDALQEQVQNLRKALQSSSDADLEQLAYTTTTRRCDFSFKKAFTADSVSALLLQLEQIPEVKHASTSTTSVGLVFAGHGSQYQGMGKKLYDTSPIFRKHIDVCEEIVRTLGVPSFLGIVKGTMDPFAFDEASVIANQCGIFAVGYAIANMWITWGVQPSILLGHSLGEYAALCVAGVLSLQDSLMLVVTRARAVFQSAQDGGMMVVQASEEEAQQLLQAFDRHSLSISCVNGPKQICISGPNRKLIELREWRATVSEWRDRAFTILPTPFAFHSPAMHFAAEQLRQACAKITFQKARIPVILNVDGRVLSAGEMLDSGYLAEQILKPVQFTACLDNQKAQEVSSWIESSARPICLPLVKSAVPSTVQTMATLTSASSDPWVSITSSLATLYEGSIGLNWSAYHQDFKGSPLPLPPYPFNRQYYWFNYHDRNLVDTPGGVVQEAQTTPVGTLTTVKKNSEYHLSTGAPLLIAQTLWIGLFVSQAAGLRSFKQSRPPTGMVTIFKHMDQLRFVDSEGEFASCHVSTQEAEIQPDMERSLGRARIYLRGSPSCLRLSSKMVANLLRKSQTYDASKETILQTLVVADDAEEAMADLASVPRDAEHHESMIKPDVIQSMLSLAELTATFQGSSAGKAYEGRIKSLDLLNKSSPDASVAHAVVGSSGFDVHLYDDDDTPMAKICGVELGSPVGDREKGRVLATMPNNRTHTEADATNYGGRREPARGMAVENVAQQATRQSAMHNEKNYQAEIPEREHIQAKTKASTIDGPSLLRVKETKPTPHSTPTETLSFQAFLETLARELDIPANTISLDDELEELGVDSIMSLILRDRFSAVTKRRLKWFSWQLGMTANGLYKKIIEDLHEKQ